ncbi:phage baseplate assembly protein V [Thiococcus pfennigii]|uniref:phage baseplate assembly protein V n=1 Tax=Thiococcus pfennigii TaxID=1057 RepID=UPI00190445C7|nr:phage baseplate assembly protein V [Thiococcus pfennigii]MBK1699382.1 hypothetical protein [Thiococcus pfennigii]
MSKASVSFLGSSNNPDTDAQEESKYFGVFTGEVINPGLDPVTQARVRVRIPAIDCLDLSYWARLCVSMAGPGHGAYCVPNIGDQVLLAFENGNVNSPYVLGSLFNARSFPPLASPLPQIRAERTITGNQVVFTEAPPTVTIQNGPTLPGIVPAPPSPIGPHQTITLNNAGVQIIGSTLTQQSGGAMETQAGGRIGIGAGGAVSVYAGAAVTIDGGGVVTISAGGAMSIQATGTVTITAPTVNIVGALTVNGKPVPV